MVPAPTNERSFHVGAVSLAPDPDTGIETAEREALDEITEEGRRYFGKRFDRAAADSGIETTSDERLEFKTHFAGVFAERLGPATRREDSYYRLCEREEELARAAVCEAYTLVSLDLVERKRIFDETLAEMMRERRAEGRGHLADLIEWMIRNL